jgi:hypothetical protein
MAIGDCEETFEDGPQPEDREAAPAWPAPPPPAGASDDPALAAYLLALPRPLRLPAIDQHECFLRLSLARLLLCQAEGALEDGSGEAEEVADLAAAIAASLESDASGEVRRTAAMACWLLGKAQLRAARPAGPGLRDAAEAFARMSAFVSRDQPSWERALAAYGLAQVRWKQGRHLDGGALFAVAALMFARVEAHEPVAACHVQHGLLLLGTGERMLARLELANAERQLAAMAAPTLEVVAALGLACCEAGAGRTADAAAQLVRARAMWRAAPVARAKGAAVPPPWRALLVPDDEGQPVGPAEEAAGRVEDGAVEGAKEGAAPALGDRSLLALLAGSPWREAYPGAVVALADRLLLGRAEDEPAAGMLDDSESR